MKIEGYGTPERTTFEIVRNDDGTHSATTAPPPTLHVTHELLTAADPAFLSWAPPNTVTFHLREGDVRYRLVEKRAAYWVATKL